MLPALWFVGGFLLGAIVVGVFWNEIKSFIKKSWETIKAIIVPATIAGFKTYLQTGDIAKALYRAKQVAIQKFYSRLENGKWKETTVAREISFEDLPSDIKSRLNKADGQEVDISNDVKKELKLEQ